MRFFLILALVGLLASAAQASVSAHEEKTHMFFFPSFGSITSIDFDQLIRSELAQESRKRLREQRLRHMPLAMKRSIAIGRAGFRPGKRTMGARRLPRLSMVLFNH